jgi:two-component system OmpR family response regulator
MRVLVIEDDAETARYIAKGLGESGYAVDVATDGKDGLLMAVGTPVLFLSAMGTVEDRVRGLKSGGDDYLIKPFAFTELLARVEVLLRRRGGNPVETVLKAGDLEMDLLARKVTRAGTAVELQPREFRILEYLLRNAGRVVTRTMLLENVWNYHFDPQTNVIDVHISRLRQKIDRGFDTPLIETVRGSGYRLRGSH